MDLSSMKFHNLLDKREANPQSLHISQWFLLLLKMAGEDLFERLMGDSDPRILNSGKSKLRILGEGNPDLSSLAIVFNGIGQKIIEELIQLILHARDEDRILRKLDLQLNVMFLG
jgi:hypothetical protein